jgi:putative ABC transport system permease protein
MLQNYLSIAIRNMKKYKQVTFINLLGLTVSIGAFLLIFLFVQYELSYDTYHQKSDRIFRVSREWLNQDKESSLHLGHVAPPFAPLLKNDFPGIVEEAVRFLQNDGLLENEEQGVKIVEDHFFFADPGLFRIFSWKLVEGDPNELLEQPNSLVLTEKAAKRYFGDIDPMGKTLIFDGNTEFQVKGIMEDVPANSHFHPEVIASFKAVENFMGKEQLMKNWGSNNYSTYLLLAEGYTPDDLAEKIPGFIDTHLGQFNGNKASDFNLLHLWPLADIHLYSHLDSEIEANGDILYVYIYSIIAFFILLIACINFINLATARSVKRSREVGIRKVMGAIRRQLIGQFLTESLIISLVALVLSLLIITLILPEFNNFVQRELSLNIGKNISLLALLAGVVMAVGLLAGSYPAFVLSSYQPASILRASRQQSGKHPYLRASLVVVQFSISIALIIGVLTVNEQLDYVKSKPLGFEGENMMVLPMNNEIYENFENLRNQWVQQDGIQSVSMASRVPSGRLLDSQQFEAEVDGEMQNASFRVADIHVDHDYLSNLAIDFVAGRNFDRQLQSDSTEAFIINEATVAAMGWDSPEEALDKEVNFGGGSRKGRIVGVVENFHFESLHQPISPMVFLVTSGRANSILVDVEPGQAAEAESFLQDQWAYLMPDNAFEYFIINERFAEQYSAESRLSTVVTFFASLAILIATLGLIGLASFTTEQRYKEIGIRKVMGASVSQILLLISSRFTMLVVLAFLLASPVAYWLMQGWLESFAYHDQVPWWSFPLAGIVAMLLAWLTIFSQTLKAANSNPVRILRE